MTFKDAILICNTVGIVEEGTDYNHSGDVWLKLADGSVMVFSSEYEEDYSDVTPGEGLQPPTVRHYDDWAKYQH